MIKCSECSAFFFTIVGRREHTNICIGYQPDDTPLQNLDHGRQEWSDYLEI